MAPVFFFTTLVGGAALLYYFASQESPISGYQHYQQVMSLENDVRLSKNYFGCLERTKVC
jgi:hypothetical protein